MYAAELTAIKEVISENENFDLKHFAIFSDSLSVLTSIKNSFSKTRPTLLSLDIRHVYACHWVVIMYMHIIRSFGTLHVYICTSLGTLHVYACHLVPFTYMHVHWLPFTCIHVIGYPSRICTSLGTLPVYACHWVLFTCMHVTEYPSRACMSWGTRHVYACH